MSVCLLAISSETANLMKLDDSSLDADAFILNNILIRPTDRWKVEKKTRAPSETSFPFNSRQDESYTLHYRSIKQRRQDCIIALDRLLKRCIHF